MKVSSNRLSFLDDALAPISRKTRMAGDPYFMGSTEREWKRQMADMRSDISRGMMSNADVMSELDLQDPNEARAFIRYVNQGRPGTRHEDIGVPHAFSSEDVYRAGIAASNNGARVEFGNQDNFQGTDLTMALNDLNQGVDVQNRQGDALSLGYLQGIENVNVSEILKESTDNTRFTDVIGQVLDRSKGNFNSDKLFQTARREKDSGMAKDYLVGGMYQRGDISNLIGEPKKGSYNFVRPRDIHQVDLSKLRGALEGLTLGDMRKEAIEPLRQRKIDDGLDKKLKLRIPMNFVNEVARTDGLIDREVVDYILRRQ